MTGSIGPSYQLIADDIRAKISGGELSVGDPIPSTAALMRQYGVSSTVVRRAVAQLEGQGVLIGHGGKAVYVQATPDDAAVQQSNINELGEKVTQLRGAVRELGERVDSVSHGSDQLRDTVGWVEAQLIDLYGKLGYDYPRQPDESRPGKRARSATAGRRERLA
jgi:DNA-binding transcriptional regulator YhcF (GntR family)